MKKREKKIGIISKLINPELRKIKSILTENEKQEIYERIVQKAKEILPDMDPKEIYDKLNDSGNIVIGNVYQKNTGFGGVKAYYNAASNLLFLHSKEPDRSQFHECMHKLQRKINNTILDKKYPIGLNEGAVEYTTERAYGDGTSGYLSIGNYDVRINFSADTIYEIEVAMINQINQILGNDRVIKSVLNGNIQWTEDFKKEYGEERFKDISKLVNQLHKKANTQKDTKTIEQIQKCQEILLTCYDEKLKSCITEQDFINYLQDLQEFQTCQIGIEGDRTYEFYQKTMFEKIKEIFISKGYSMNKLNNYIYAEPKYNPTMTIQKQLKGQELDMIGIARDCVDTEQMHQLSEYTRKMDPNNLGYDLIQRDGKLISCRIWKEKAWQIYEKPTVVGNKLLKSKFNISESQTLYQINENVFIVENSDGNVELYDLNKSTTQKIDNFEQIDIGIPEQVFNSRIEKFIKSEKRDRRIQERANRKMLKDNKPIAMLPEGNSEVQIDESKRFRESMRRENFISQDTQNNYGYEARTKTDRTKTLNNSELKKDEGR